MMAYTALQFLDIIHGPVVRDMQENKILASLTGAQALLESNKGNSGLTQRANNLFGIKADKRWTGPYITMPTKETVNGQLVTVQAKFRSYGSWSESIHDHSNFLLTNKRYSNLIGVVDYRLACVLIKQDGYATSETYTQNLISVIEKYNLQLWDIEALSKESGVTYQIGQVRTLSSNMYVRSEPAGEHKHFNELTPNGKAHAFEDENGAVLIKGTRVTIKDIQTLYTGAIWLKIPSGWICGKGASGKTYVT